MVFIRTDRAPICVQGIWYIPFAFPAYVFTGYPFFGRETRPFLLSKNYFDWRRCFATPISTTLFLKNRETFAVCTGLEPVTSAVVADMGFEPIREVLNIHLARLLASRLSTIRQSASDLFQVYSCIQGSILTD